MKPPLPKNKEFTWINGPNEIENAWKDHWESIVSLSSDSTKLGDNLERSI